MKCGKWNMLYPGNREFVKRASSLSRHGHFLDGLHAFLQSLFDKMATTSPHSMALERTAAMRKWPMRFAELKAAGINRLEKFPPHAKEVLGGKNMALFAEMVEASGSPHTGLANYISKGWTSWGLCLLVVSIPRSPCMQPCSLDKFVRCHPSPGTPHGVQFAVPGTMRCARTCTIRPWKNARRDG